MKTLSIGLLFVVALVMSGVFSTTSFPVKGQSITLATADLPIFVPLTQDLSPLIELLN